MFLEADLASPLDRSVYYFKWFNFLFIRIFISFSLVIFYPRDNFSAISFFYLFYFIIFFYFFEYTN